MAKIARIRNAGSAAGDPFFAEAIVEQSERCTDRVRVALKSFFAMVRVHETLDAVKKQRIGPEPLLEMLCGIH